MAEAGGPIFEGSSARAEQSKLGKVAEKVRTRVVDRLKQNTGEMVEQKWMDAYQKTVDALDPGKRKNILEKLRWPAKAVAKVVRFVVGYKDIRQLVFGVTSGVGGAAEVVAPGVFQKKVSGFEKKSIKDIRIQGALGVGKGVIDVVLGGARIRRVAAGWLGDIAGTGGEKIAQISNKIFSGKPKAEAMPVA